MQHVTEQIEIYLTGGLSPEQRRSFDEHIAGCETCAAALADAKAVDAVMKELFAAAQPSADFEDRMIHALSLHQPHPWLTRPIVHPMVRKAAVGIAASLMIAGIGWTVNRGMDTGRLPGWTFSDEALKAKTSSNLKNIAAAMIQYQGVTQVTHSSPTRDLKTNAIALTKQGRYKEALGEVDQILKQNPKDDYALGVRPVLEDRYQFQAQRNAGDSRRPYLATQNPQSANGVAPSDDVLRYPGQWPDVEGKKDGKPNDPSVALSWKESVPALNQPVGQSTPASSAPLNTGVYSEATARGYGGPGPGQGGISGGGGAGGGKPQATAGPVDSSLSRAKDGEGFGFGPKKTERLREEEQQLTANYYAVPKAAPVGGPGAQAANEPGASANTALGMKDTPPPTTLTDLAGRPPAPTAAPALQTDTGKAALVAAGASTPAQNGFIPADHEKEVKMQTFAEAPAAKAKLDLDEKLSKEAGRDKGVDIPVKAEKTVEQVADPAPTEAPKPEKELAELNRTTEKAAEKDQKKVEAQAAYDNEVAVAIAQADVKPKSDATNRPEAGDYEPAPQPKPAPNSPPANNAAAPQPQPAPPRVNNPGAARPKIIRTGEMEFEVDSFESSVTTITKVVEEEGGYVSTTNSDKLPNGKVKGTVVLRVTPEHLDTLVLKLRGIGDLKTQNIRAQDITKEYTDLESRLRAAQIMCDQILDIIKSGKANVKDLLEAEKQLGVYREKVEQLTGEINYYASQIALSTLTLTLFERDIRTPAVANEIETVTMTLVTEKVDDAAAKAKDAIAAAKGRIIGSQQSATDEGQSTATIKAQVPPDKAEEVIAKLKQIEGQLDHFDRQRSQTTSNGNSPVDPRSTDPLKIKREDVTIDLTLYNLAKLTPRRTTNLSLAATDVDDAKHELEEQVRTAGGRVIDARTEYPRPDQKQGTITFDVPTEKADALIAALKGLGETLQISMIENPAGTGVTESKRGFTAVIYDMASVQPRRQTTLTLVSATVDQSQSALADQVKAAGGRVIGRKIEHPAPDQSVGLLAFELPTAKADAFLTAMKSQGEIMQVNTSDNNAAQNVTDSKRGFQVSILDLASVMPRRVTSMTLVTSTVDASETGLVEQVRAAGGRIISRKVDHPAPDQSVGSVSFDVPSDKADALLLAIKQMGEALNLSTADNTGQPIITDVKRGFNITLRSLTTFKARESEQITLASATVRDTFNDLRSLIHAQSGHVLTEHLNEEDTSNSVGQLEYEVSRDASAAIEQQMGKDGQIVTRLDDRRSNGDDTIDTKVYVRLTISSAEQLPPRQSSSLSVEVTDVQRAMDDLGAAALQAGGRQVDNPAITQNAGQTTATVQYDVPLQQIQLLVDKADAMGVRKNRQTTVDTHAPDGKLARARMTVTFESPATLSNPDDSLWAGIRRGLVTSLKVLSYSLTLIIIGLCVVVPFGVVFWGGWRGVRFARRTKPAPQSTTT